ncbi:MAG: DUF389 domain-containing protein [Planctomycetota bacterium]|nr:DUF389 domain-containing protein [Planctomycetota bacterium]
MTVAALITEENQLDTLLGWGRLLADAEKTDLDLIVFQKSASAKKQWVQTETEKEIQNLSPLASKILTRLETESRPGDSGEEGPPPPTQADAPQVSIRILKDSQPEWSFVDEIETMDITLLLLPEFQVARANDESSSWIQSLYRQAPCETLQVVDGCPGEKGLNVLVTATGQADDFTAIQRGLKIAEQSGGQVTASYFEPDIDPVAIEVGRKILRKIVDNSVGKDAGKVQQQVILANSFSKGLSYFDLSRFDLVICGTRNIRESGRFLNQSALKKLDHRTGLATARRPIPFSSRFVNKLQNFLEGFVPQLKRDQRIDLVQRVQNSSKWDFDFGALISLATLIAALGLIRNSPSVVIGAMLVAPLMTPIVGAGLGLAQSNIHLVKTSLRTVVCGFATAFLIGILLGALLSPNVSPEMAARGEPNLLDLVVALVSGIAAAYALGRPDLLSALPGVAIAAALVPPLATSGMALALWEFQLSYGSLLLFVTNIIAIILGTTITFWMVGIRPANKDRRGEIWPLWLFLLLVFLTFGDTIMVALNQQSVFK